MTLPSRHKIKPWRSEVAYATSRSRRLPTIPSFTSGWGRNTFVSFKPPRPGNEPRALAWKAAVLTTTLGPPPNPMSELGYAPLLWNDFKVFYSIQHCIIHVHSRHLINQEHCICTTTITSDQFYRLQRGDQFRHQNLTSTVTSEGDPHTGLIKSKIFIIAVGQQHRYSNEAGLAN